RGPFERIELARLPHVRRPPRMPRGATSTALAGRSGGSAVSDWMSTASARVDDDGACAITGPCFMGLEVDETRLWAVVLAGGEGIRLRRLTRYVSGDLRPKQFARLLWGRSLLRQTLDRTKLNIPWTRTVVVAQQRHARYVGEEFAGLARPYVLMQPDDRGTAT